MNAPTNPIASAGAIPLDDIDNLIAQLVALRAEPSRFNHRYLEFLRAADEIIGMDALHDEIQQAETDLEGAECLACGESFCGCDQIHDDRSSYGMGEGWNRVEY